MNRRTLRTCTKCGKIFQGDIDSILCPNCARESRKQSTIRDRICIDCGRLFPGGPRARRCPKCRAVRQKEVDRLRRQSGGTKRPLGSIDKCQRCGKEYIVEGGRQKYCPACQRDAALEWQRGRKAEYNKRPEVDQKRRERREKRQKACVYCLRPFWSSATTNLCSAYCRAEQGRLNRCRTDVKRGQSHNLQALLDRREEYRKKVKTELMQ